MNVEEMERRFFELKGKLDVGAITEAEFKFEIEKLKFQDQQGRWWMIGAQSGKWYSFDGARWLPGKPPEEELPAPPPPAEPEVPPIEPAPAPAAAQVEPPAPAPQPTREIEPAVSESAHPPASETRTADLTPPMVALPTAEHLEPPPSALPPMPEHLQRAPLKSTPPPPPLELERLRSARARFSLPISGPLIVGAAAMFAIVAVLCMWLAIDNLVPSRPISGFFAGLAGGKPATSLTPTPVAGQSSAPKEIAALIAMGDRLLLQSNVDSAITQYQSAAQLAPSSPIPLTRWSRALAFKGQMQSALDKARQATQRGPSDAEAYAQLCRALAWSGQDSDAIAAGEKAVQLDPKNANARAYLAEAYLLARRLSDAQSQAQTALQLAPQSAEAYRAQAWVFTIQGNKDAALDAWRQTAALEPDFYFRHFELGEALRVYFKSPAEAVPEYQKSVGLYGAYVPAISRLGIALVDVNKPADATGQLARAITLDPKDATAYAYLGIAFGQDKECSQAIPYFEQALKLDPNSSLAQRGLGDCKTGKTPSAPASEPPSVPAPPPTLVPASP